MARTVEKEAKTVDEAIALALEELGVELEDVDVEILDSGSRTVMGLFGDRAARVRVTENVSDNNILKAFIEQLLDVSGSVDNPAEYVLYEESSQDGQKLICVDISGDDVAYLIGKHGETLQSINYVANLMINKERDLYRRVRIDVGGYRKNREDKLAAIAKRAADRVVKYKRPVSLEPMNAADRRIVHTALQMNSKVTTESQGEEPNRCVVVKLKPYVKKF